MGALGRAFLRTGSLVQRRLPRLHPYWSGVWLGLLSGSALHSIDAALYELRLNYSGSDHNLSGLFFWEEDALREFFVGRRSIMVLGAGGGRELVALRRATIPAEGWECNPKLLAVAREVMAAEGHLNIVHAMDRDRFPPTDNSFDAAILGWSMYMLVQGRDTRIRLLSDLRSRLPAGAPILVSFFTRPENDRRAPRVLRIAATLRRLTGGPEPEAGDDMAPNYLHRFTRAEIDAEMRDGGFRMVRWEPMGAGRYDSGWAVGLAGVLDDSRANREAR